MPSSVPATVDLEPLSSTERILFQAANAAVLPVWIGMVVAPRSALTRRLVQTTPPLLAGFSAAYTVLLARAIARRGGRPPNYFDVEEVRRLLGSRDAINAAWIHYLAFDLFVGRALWQEADNEGRTARAETLVTFLAGPMGWLVSEGRRRLRA